MGLDQFAFSVAAEGLHPGPNPGVDPQIDSTFGYDEIFYWRKHPSLQGWMTGLYLKKGGKEIQWGSMTGSVLLTRADLLRLRKDISSGNLPHTEGFFFGVDSNDDEERNIDLAFVRAALKELKKGKKILYTCWW